MSLRSTDDNFRALVLICCAMHSPLQDVMAYPEDAPMTFTLFKGNVITLHPDGAFEIDGQTCPGAVYTGVAEC